MWRPGVSSDDGENPVHAIVIADADMLGEQFFQLRRQGVEDLNFDNVTFLLNAVDRLAGDDSFIELRKRRRRHRTPRDRGGANPQVRGGPAGGDAPRGAGGRGKARGGTGPAWMPPSRPCRAAPTLDAQTKRIMISNQERIENRRLSVARSNIEDEKERLIEGARGDMEAAVRAIQNTIKLVAVALSPRPGVPAVPAGFRQAAPAGGRGRGAAPAGGDL